MDFKNSRAEQLDFLSRQGFDVVEYHRVNGSNIIREIENYAKKIETYDISIRPYEDCCTIFVPEHPVINPVSKLAKEYEESFDYESLIKEAINNDKVIKLPINNKEFDSLL